MCVTRESINRVAVALWTCDLSITTVSMSDANLEVPLTFCFMILCSICDDVDAPEYTQLHS